MGNAHGRDLVLVGAGNMGMALLDGWISKGVCDLGDVAIIEPNPGPALEDLTKGSQAAVILDPADADLTAARAVILAVKPQILGDVLTQLPAADAQKAVFISIAAGQSVSMMETYLGANTPIVRAMPNTPASIGQGITAYFASSVVSLPQRAFCQTLLSAVGEAVELADESLIDLVTAVSGSGPAYIFLFIECLAEAGREAGLDEALALQLAKATVSGAGALAMASGDSPSVLRENVTSPGGTTEAALKVLRSDKGLQPLISKAVKAAIARAKELDG